MVSLKKAVLIALLGLAAATSLVGQVTAVRFSRLLPMRGEPVADAVVLVEGKTIKAVGRGDGFIPPGARVVDLRPLVGLPGLIDAHAHMSFYWDRAPGTNPWGSLESVSTPVLVFLAQENARRTLEAGVTTVRDLGAVDYADIAMRDLIQRGAMPGPRMFVAGAGLHTSGYALNRPGVSQPDPGRADGVDGVLYAARQQLAMSITGRNSDTGRRSCGASTTIASATWPRSGRPRGQECGSPWDRTRSLQGLERTPGSSKRSSKPA